MLLEQRLRADGFDIAVSNAGVSGDTASDMLERLDWAMGEHTDFAIVEAGANDMLRGLDPALTKQAIAAILMGLRAKGVRPLLAGMVAAPGMGQPFEANFNAIYPALAAEFGVPLYPFFLDGVAGARGLTQSDGMHPNAAGERVVVERIAPAVEALIRQGVKTP